MTQPTGSVNHPLIEQEVTEEDVGWPGMLTRLRPIAFWFVLGAAALPVVIWLIGGR